MEAPPRPNHQTEYPYPDIDFSTCSPFIATAVITAIMRSTAVTTAGVSFFAVLVVVMIASDLGAKLNYIIFFDLSHETEKISFCFFLETLEAAFYGGRAFLRSVNNQDIGSLQLKSVQGVCAR